MLQKILTKKKSFLWVLEIVTFVMENVMEKSWNFVLEKLYEPCAKKALVVLSVYVSIYVRYLINGEDNKLLIIFNEINI